MLIKNSQLLVESKFAERKKTFKNVSFHTFPPKQKISHAELGASVTDKGL